MKSSFIRELQVGAVGFFGLGRSNAALMRMIGKDTRLILRSDEVIDQENFPDGVKASEIYLGRKSCDNIQEDTLVFSPSVRRDRQELLSALERGVVFTSDFEIFLRYNKKPLFLVTGSDGKTTTTTLISRILGFPAIGNIGEPMTPHLDDEAEGFAVEVSSFMLEYAHPKSRRAAITSLTENHLNWHYTIADYRRAKLRAIEGADEAVITTDSPLLFEGKLPKSIFAVCGTHGQTEEVARRLSAEVYYSVEDGYITKNGQRILPTQDLRRREKYNIKNYLTALALTVGFAPEERALEIIRDFGGIPHRGERFDKISGIEFINSSIDTTPERTMSTLREMPEGIIILLGGRDKGLDLTRLSAVINKRGDRAIVFGEAEDKFATAFGDRCIKAHGGLGCAIAKAKEIAKTNDTILLSPGATSYDEFRSFENRGDEFKRLVKEVF